MKKTTLTILLATLAMPGAHAGEFDGGFVGAKAGLNRSDISGATTVGGKDSTIYGLDGGYNWDMQRFMLGLDAFADFNGKKDHAGVNYGSDVYGLGVKLGLPNGIWMPYLRLDYARTKGTGSSSISGNDLYGALGIEYKYSPSWGVNAEWSAGSAKSNGSKLKNNNLTVGLRYYFGSSTTPAPVAAVKGSEPLVVKKVHEEPTYPSMLVRGPEPLRNVQGEEPAPVMRPAPAPMPAPVVKAAPEPRESWKTILTETPVRLEGANFATSSARLLKSANVKLNEVVKAAEHYSEVGLEVSGHTDSTGNKAFNQKLSEDRAAAVKAYLVKHGVAAERISTVGYADTQPIADNKTKAGRAANRRVEVRYVIREEKKVRVTE